MSLLRLLRLPCCACCAAPALPHLLCRRRPAGLAPLARGHRVQAPRLSPSPLPAGGLNKTAIKELLKQEACRPHVGVYVNTILRPRYQARCRGGSGAQQPARGRPGETHSGSARRAGACAPALRQPGRLAERRGN